jgi:hypothetical protein
MKYLHWSALWALLLVTPVTPVRADDPHPPQLNVTLLAQSAAIVHDGGTRLYYEMVISNFITSSYVLDAVDAKAGATETKLEGPALVAAVLRLDRRGQPQSGADGMIEGGRGVIVLLGWM